MKGVEGEIEEKDSKDIQGETRGAVKKPIERVWSFTPHSSNACCIYCPEIR
jgi:hypothetical protein